MKYSLALMASLAGAVIMVSSTIFVAAAEAQRRGGGGRGGGAAIQAGARPWGAQASRPSNGPAMRGGSRNSINQRIAGNRGSGDRINQPIAANANRGGGNRINQPIAGNINRGSGNRINQPIAGDGNRGNINGGDINIDVDHNYGWGGGSYYRPGYGAGVVVGAAIIGSYYPALPPHCVAIVRVPWTYYQCGSAWYQPVYSGSTIQYVVIAAP